MAPIKKRARNDDEEIISVESGSSYLRQGTQHKKVRLSAGGASSSKSRVQRDRSPSASSNASGGDIPEEAGDGSALPTSTQYELFRDNGFKHLENPEHDDEKATQQFLARKQTRERQSSRIGNNRAASNAIIEEITCINFMCHDRLHVTLGPLINFVVGQNGSGKSAVLTAITLCLGGKVSATNRAANLKALIKTGRDQAILIVRLKNEGNDAFQADIYGDSIIIERHFSRTGNSSFKLKSATGRTVSTKKGDVDDIVEYFQLQVDNPMNVLTQDAAKSFIQTSTSAQKYKFFVEGVQLQALDNDYKLISDTCDSISAKLQGSQDDLAELKKRADEAKRRAEVALQHEGLRSQAKRLGYKLAWSQVVEMEHALAERENRLRNGQRAVEDAENVARGKDELFQGTEAALERAKEAERQSKESLAPLIEAEETAKTEFDSVKAEVTSTHTQTKGIKDDMTAAQSKVSHYNKAIRDEEEKLEAANGGAHVRKQVEIQKAEQVLSGAKARLKQNVDESSDLEDKRNTAEHALSAVKDKLNSKRTRTKAAQDALHSLNQDRGNTMAGFHPSMSKILRRLREDDGFAETPIGPLGMHMRLKEPAWSPILESQLGQALNGFVVTSKSDEKRLISILDREKIRFFTPVFVIQPNAVRQLQEPEPQFNTILRVLDIDSELVRNALIINQAIEQQILVKRREDGLNIMFEGPRPINVKRCYTFHDTQAGFGLNMGFSGRGGRGRAIDSIQPPRSSQPRMKTDIESRINSQREVVEELEKQQAQIDGEKRQAETWLQRCTQAITQHKREYGKLKIEVHRAEEELEKLRSELSGIDVEDGHIETLKDDLKAAERELKICQEAYGNSKLEESTLNTTASDKKRALDTAKAQLREQETKVQKAQDKIRNVEQARSLILREKNLAINNVEAAKIQVAKLEQKREAAAAQVEDFTRQAQQVCDRVELEASETHDSLAIAQKKIVQHLKEYTRKQGGTDLQIFDAAEQAENAWKSAETNQKELTELLGLLKDSFVKRIEMFRRFQQHISAASRISFSYLLSERAFRGKLTIDHKAKKLDVHVEPDETNKSGKGRQTKTLSGGEKSFSSICLLLALWEAMSAPLRCLDEFDVFMDDVNRDVSTKMIISAARCSVGRQFILITPKALGAGVADGAEDVHIIKLFDPREKQKRINEMMEGV